MINGRLIDRWSDTGCRWLVGRRQGRQGGWYLMSTESSVWSLDCRLVVLEIRRQELSARSQPERLQMARSTVKEGSLSEPITQRGARVI